MNSTVLIIFGAIIIAVFIIYLIARYRSANQSDIRRHQDPDLGLEMASDAVDMPEIITNAIGNQKTNEMEDSLSSEQVDIEEKTPVSKIERPSVHIVIGLLADDNRPYTGYELLQALLTNGLRFGKQGLFHRYESLSGSGEILFSLANAGDPPNFDIHKMGSVCCVGLTLFINIAQIKDPLHAFQLMIKVAKQLREDLGGKLRDENNQPLTKERIDELKTKVEKYLLSQQSDDLFATE